MAPRIGRLIATLSLDPSQFTRGLTRIERRTRLAAERMQMVGADLTRALTVPIGGALAASVKFATDFETELTKLETQIGVSREEVEALRASVLSLGAATGRGPTELARAMFAVQSAGARGEQALSILERAAKASAIGLGDTRDVALAVTSAMTAYGAENLSAARATEVLLATVREGNLEAESLAASLGRVIGIAAQTGVTFAEAGAFIAGFTRVGVKADEAVTSLRGVLNAIQNPQQKTLEALGSIGLSVQDVRDRIENQGLTAAFVGIVEALRKTSKGSADFSSKLSGLIPNVRALSGFLANFVSQQDEVLRISRDMAGELDNLDEGFARVQQTTRAAFDELKASAEVLAITVGQDLLPAVNDTLRVLIDWVQAFSRADASTRRLVTQVGAVAAALGPLALGLAITTKAVTALAASLVRVALFASRAFLILLPALPWLALGAAVGAVALSLSGVSDWLRRIPIIGEPVANFLDDLKRRLLDFAADVVGALADALDSLIVFGETLSNTRYVPQFISDAFNSSVDEASEKLGKFERELRDARAASLFEQQLRVEFALDPVLEPGQFGPAISKAVRAELAGEIVGPTADLLKRPPPVRPPPPPPGAGTGAATDEAARKALATAQRRLSEALAQLGAEVTDLGIAEAFDRETADVVRQFRELAIAAGADVEVVEGTVRQLRGELRRSAEAAERLDAELDLGTFVAELEGDLADLRLADPFERETERIVRAVREMAEAAGVEADEFVARVREIRAEVSALEEERANRVDLNLGSAVAGGVREIASGLLRGTREIESAGEVFRDVLVGVVSDAWAQIIENKLRDLDIPLVQNVGGLGSKAGAAFDGDSLVAPFRNAFSKVVEIGRSAMESLAEVVKAAVRGIGKLASGLFGGSGGGGFSFGTLFSGLTLPSLPLFDSGGIVTKPTLGVLAGNSKPEAVIPLSRLGDLGGSANVEINIHGVSERPQVRQSQRGGTQVFDLMFADAMQRSVQQNGAAFRAITDAIGAQRVAAAR